MMFHLTLLIEHTSRVSVQVLLVQVCRRLHFPYEPRSSIQALCKFKSLHAIRMQAVRNYLSYLVELLLLTLKVVLQLMLLVRRLRLL